MNLSQLKSIQNNASYCLVAGRDHFLYTSHARGIQPIMSQLAKDPHYFQDCIVVDCVIGKAAAMMFVYSHAAFVYGRIMSKAAEVFLQEHQMPYACEKHVDAIINRTKDGLCPMEQAVRTIDDVDDAYPILVATLKSLREPKETIA